MEFIAFFNAGVAGALIGVIFMDWQLRRNATKEMRELSEIWAADLKAFREVHNDIVVQVKSLSERMNAQEFRAHNVMGKK